MALTKVTEASLFAIASTASNVDTVGSAVDVSTYYSIDARIRMGRGTATAFAPGPKLRIEGAYKVSPSANEWVTIVEFQCAIGVSIASQTVSSGGGPGSTAVTLAAGTNFAADDYIFFHHTTLANSEWKHVISVAGAVVTIQDGLVLDQAAATVRDQAEEYHALIDCTSLQKIRLVVNNAGTGQAVIVEAGFAAVSGL